jgi:hypothetical protein
MRSGRVRRESASDARRGRVARPARAAPFLAAAGLATLAGGIGVGVTVPGLAGRPATAWTAAAGCGARPAAAVLTSVVSAAAVAPSPSPSQTTPPPLTTAGASPAPTPSPTPPLKTVGPSPTQTPTPSPTPPLKTVGPSPTPTPTPTKTTTPPPPTPQLCVGIQAFSGSADVQPGHPASYAIWVWAVGAAATRADVRIRASRATGITGPAFTVCPHGRGATCSLGSLPTSRSDELTAGIGVGSQAPGGDHVVLTATATAHGARSGSASAVVKIVTPSAGNPSGLSNTALEFGSAGGDYPPLANYPGVTPVNPTTLFPTVSPGSGSGRHDGRRAARIGAVTTAAVTPLGSLMLSGQVLGLAVLAGAVALAFVRFSLRTPQPGGPRKPES